MYIYKTIIRPLLFKIDPEKMHDIAIGVGKFFGNGFLRRNFIGVLCRYRNKKLENVVCGIRFENPVGLAAGFDKDAYLMDIVPYLGFGFEEVGSITGEKCLGNKKPRLWRLPKDNAIVVNYGLKNNGAEEISKRIRSKKFEIPIGINIAKTNDPKIKGNESVEDYYKAFKLTENIGNYTTINISCPNVGDGRSFEDCDLLEKLLRRVGKTSRIIFLKISPDIKISNLNAIIELAIKYKIDGFIISNLSKKRNNLKSSKKEIEKTSGGVSGDPVYEKSNELIRYVYKRTNGKFVIIGCGGIDNAEKTYEKIKDGASLVQLITGMIYKGPFVIKEINKGLVKLLEKDSYKNIKEAIGVNIK